MRFPADVEAEDMELGDDQENDLALDVDGDETAVEDLDALDTDEDEEDNQRLGIDADECDSTCRSHSVRARALKIACFSTNAYRAAILPAL